MLYGFCNTLETLTFHIRMKRKLLIDILNNEKVRFIDTYDFLHGKLNNNHAKKDLWLGYTMHWGIELFVMPFWNLKYINNEFKSKIFS